MRTVVILLVLAVIVGLIYKVVTQNTTISKADGYVGKELPTDWKTKA